MLDNFTAALTKELLRALSGRLFTDAEIRGITSHAVGKYLKDWFPEPEKEQAARERVEEARHHRTSAAPLGKLVGRVSRTRVSNRTPS